MVKLTVTDEANNKKIYYKWILPTHFLFNLVPVENSNNSNKENDKDKDKDKDKEDLLKENEVIPKIPFRNDFGMIGFRSTPSEEATVKDLIIKGI